MEPTLDQPGGLQALLKYPELMTPPNPLAALFRRLLQDLGVNREQWGNLMDDYLHRHFPHASGAQDAMLRSNLARALMEPVLTWDTFLKGLDLLGVKAGEVSFVATVDNAYHVRHEQRVSAEVTIDTETQWELRPKDHAGDH